MSQAEKKAAATKRDKLKLFNSAKGAEATQPDKSICSRKKRRRNWQRKRGCSWKEKGEEELVCNEKDAILG